MSGITKGIAAVIRLPLNWGTAAVKQIAHDIEVLNEQEAANERMRLAHTPNSSAPSITELDEEQLQAELRRRAQMRKAQAQK